VRFVAIAGTILSGKTTFAFKLCTQLQVRGKKTLKITLDDYYLPPDQCPKDQDGKPDFERLEALNLPLLQHTLQAIQDGEEVSLPTYDFVQKKTTFGEKIKLDAKTIVVMEGIHGMNPALTGSLDSDLIFRVYISAFTQVNIDDHNRISTTDNRIIRRIVRDHRTRGASAEQTLSMIPSIQRGENLYIFPYQGNADMMINSALDYELAVLAPFAQPLLKMVKPSATVVYVTARRLLKFLDNFQPIPDTLVPSDSLLREFIGGSEYGVT
jgi:uridine kinase